MSFFEKVYEIVKTVPEGKVISYGKVALLSGNPKAARQVGWALHANPYPGVVPCHRVVNRFGELSPAFAFGGENMQIQLLSADGVEFVDGHVNMEKYLWRPDGDEK